MIKSLFLFIIVFISSNLDLNYRIPINTEDRRSLNDVELTEIGQFGLLRKERPGNPAHYHTGVDIKRPSNNFNNELLFPIAEGIVISKHQDGPYAQIIIEHEFEHKFWTVYEHIAGIKVNLSEYVNRFTPIARFMNDDELNRYGWQFDHFHFEV